MNARGEERLIKVFAEAEKENRSAFMPYLSGGDPSLEATEKLLRAYEEAGADLVEFGVPFSDPIADGPTIQSAGDRAIAAGGTLEALLDLLAKLRRGKFDLPAVLMSYYNPMYVMGLDRFVEKADASGVDGLIVPDLPLEEAGDLSAAIERAGASLPIIQLIAPTTAPERMSRLAKASRGFIYYVSLAGVTGERTDLAADLAEQVRRIKAVTETPVAVGFGVSTAEHAKQVAQVADGVIVGSALVKENHQNGVEGAARLAKRLAEACRR